MNTTDVAIVGGGVIGLTLAYLLAKEKRSVTLIDKGDLGREASWAGAGILPAGNPKRAKSAMGKLRSQAVAFFPEFSAELKSLTGIDNGYWQCGGLELRSNADQLEQKRLEHMAQVEKGEGLHCEILDAAALLKLEPGLASTLPGAIYFPGVAQIRNPRHLQALIAGCQSLGVNLKPNEPATTIELTGGRISGIVTPSGTIRADKYVVAAGTWTTGILAELGWQPALKPIRGQIVLLNPMGSGELQGASALSPVLDNIHTMQPMTPATVPPLRQILLMGHRYLVPRQDGKVLIGSTEEDVGFDKTPTESVGATLRALAAETVPALATAPVERHWAGLRPGSADGKPYLGLVPGYDNIYVAAGHFRSGLQLSIMTGVLMRAMLLGQQPILDMTPFRPERPITNPIPWIAHAQ